ncbi:MAG TPA: DUF4365 domain-containing protein [Allocoleopsis sp.]
MKRDLQHFIGERAEFLAIVHLTRRPDVVIERMRSDYGLDILVTTLKDKLPTGRVFGVQVKGQDKAVNDLKELAISLTNPVIPDPQDLPFPVCVFLFTMEDDRGYYRWTKYSPSQSSQAANAVTPHQWHCLDEHAVEQIIEDVNAWYDAKRHSAA